jgi:outer membrane receptor for ferric coprogen and ferric-rhodotorulic acid
LWNANLNYLSTGEQWSGNVAFRNISDETYPLNVLDYLSCCNVLGVSGAPRTVEVSVQYSF